MPIDVNTLMLDQDFQEIKFEHICGLIYKFMLIGVVPYRRISGFDGPELYYYFSSGQINFNKSVI